MHHDSITWLHDKKEHCFLLTVDHAGKSIPKELNNLGLNNEEAIEILQSHRCYDIGTENLTRTLSARQEIPAIMTHYSRLVVDVNRHRDDPTCIRPIYDCRPIWGNYPLDEATRTQRIADYYMPFHHGIAGYIRHYAQMKKPLFLISIHSFTPQLENAPKRKEDIAILYHQSQPFMDKALQYLGKDGLIVGDNQPYSSKGVFGYTLALHGTCNHIPAITIEYRQDYLQDEEKMDYFIALTEGLLDLLAPFATVPQCQEFNSDIEIVT